MESTTIEDYQSQSVATMIAVIKALHNVFPHHGGAGVALLTDNGSNTSITNNVSDDEEAVHSVRFDHNGDPV